MLKKIFNWWNSYLAYRDAMKGAKYFEKHPHLQERLEIIEDWCEELEVRLDQLQETKK
jgi:hypothetical protein